MNSKEIESIVKQYEKGKSLNKLGKEYKTYKEAIKKILLKRGVKIRGRGINIV